MIIFNSFAVLAKISLVILVLKMTISVNNGEVRVVQVGRVASKTICQGTTLKFKCVNASLAMVIYSAYYGRDVEGRVVCPFRKHLVDHSVIKANETDDETPCPEVNVTSQIMKLCDKKRRCIVTVNETYFGNPCRGIYKFVKIIYGCGVQITIQVNGTNYTLPNKTLNTTLRPSILTITPKGLPSDNTQNSPSPKAASSAAPVVMGQASPEVVMGVAGSLYLWFLHMKENQATYTTVFILSALGAAIIMVAVVACFLTLQKKKEFIKLDVMHKPKRFISLPKETGATNQNGHVPGKGDKPADAVEAPDGIMLQKGPEVVFTAHDVNNHVSKEFNIDRYSGIENGTINKENGPGIHVNPMCNSGNNNNNNNKPFSSVTNTNPANPHVDEAVTSLPSTPSRSRTLSEPRTGTARRGRANSTGNVSRSHERHHSQGMSDYQDEKLRIPRHLSAGNVSHQHRQGTNSDQASHIQSPARTLPRQRAATGNASCSQSPVRNPPNWHQIAQPTHASGTSTPGMHINSISQQQSPARSVSGGPFLNQYTTSSGTLNNRQQSPGSEHLSPSRSPQYSSLSHQLKDLGPGTAVRDGDPNYQGKPLSVAPGETQTATHSSSPYHRANPNSPMKVSSSLNTTLGLESNTGTSTPYSGHRNIPTLNRKWSEEKQTNDAAPNITTNPNYINKHGDIWQKNSDAKTGQKDTIGRSFGTDQGNIQGGILQYRKVSAEKSSSPEQVSNKGTMRAPSMGELLSPLDALPDAYANNSNLRFSDRHPYSNTQGTSSFHPSTPQPPELPIDSSDDDLYSIVAKGTYSSAVPDPNLRHNSRATSMTVGREGKNRNKHVYVVVPSRDGSTAV